MLSQENFIGYVTTTSNNTLTNNFETNGALYGRYLQDKTNLREQRNWLRDRMGFLATSRKEFQLMLMIWSEVAPIREVIESSKGSLFVFFFVGNLFWGDKGCFLFQQRQFLLRLSQKTFLKIRYYIVLLHLGAQRSI